MTTQSIRFWRHLMTSTQLRRLFSVLPADSPSLPYPYGRLSALACWEPQLQLELGVGLRRTPVRVRRCSCFASKAQQSGWTVTVRATLRYCCSCPTSSAYRGDPSTSTWVSDYRGRRRYREGIPSRWVTEGESGTVHRRLRVDLLVASAVFVVESRE